jgi:hypothetical protein
MLGTVFHETNLFVSFRDLQGLHHRRVKGLDQALLLLGRPVSSYLNLGNGHLLFLILLERITPS